jgi:hypothetical protein
MEDDNLFRKKMCMFQIEYVLNKLFSHSSFYTMDQSRENSYLVSICNIIYISPFVANTILYQSFRIINKKVIESIEKTTDDLTTF